MRRKTEVDKKYVPERSDFGWPPMDSKPKGSQIENSQCKDKVTRQKCLALFKRTNKNCRLFRSTLFEVDSLSASEKAKRRAKMAVKEK